MTSPARTRLEQQSAQAEIDIAEVEAQLEAGEMDRATADDLITRYRQEIAQTQHQIEVLAGAEAALETQPPDPVARRRRLVGAALLVGAFVAIGVLAAQAIQPRQAGQFVTGGPVDESGGVDLDTVTNDQMEAVIAANADAPEVAQMRVALANRYFEEGDFSAALDHFIQAAEGQLRPDQRAQSLGRIGWMTYLSGRTDLAEDYLDQALLVDVDYAEGEFFLGLLHLYGNDDPASAQPFLERVAARDDLPDDIRTQVDAALQDARTASTPAGGG